MTMGLSPREWEAMEHMVRAWNAFIALEQQHPDDLPDFRHHFHACQRIILTRPIWREGRHLEDFLP